MEVIALASAECEVLARLAPHLALDEPGEDFSLTRFAEAVSASAQESRRLKAVAKALTDAVRSSARGYAILDIAPSLSAGQEGAIAVATAVCAMLGRPLRTITAAPFWKEAAVDLAKDENSFGGAGFLPLHIDHVNATMPPDITALLCLRPDPAGGGESIVSNMLRAAETLNAHEIEELSAPEFVEGAFYGLQGVGRELNPFPVLRTGEDGFWRVRYTAKLLYTLKPGPKRDALVKFTELLDESAETYALAAGQLLLMNQRVVAHGRLPLGADQSAIPVDSRRLCRQGHVRVQPGTRAVLA